MDKGWDVIQVNQWKVDMWQVRGQKGNKIKKIKIKEQLLFFLGLESSSGGEKQILERESLTSL